MRELRSKTCTASDQSLMENVENILLKNNFPSIYHTLYFMLSPLPPFFPYWHKNKIFVLTELIRSCFHMGPQAPHLWKDPWKQKNYWVSSTCSPQREEISGLTKVWTVNIVVPKDPWRTWTQSPAQSAQFPAIAFPSSLPAGISLSIYQLGFFRRCAVWAALLQLCCLPFPKVWKAHSGLTISTCKPCWWEGI